MAIQTVTFQFFTGLKRSIFRNARLSGSWDGNGRYADNWLETAMQESVGADGCPVFTASMQLDTSDRDKTFKWGVVLDGPQGSNFWGIATELQDVNSVERYRMFRLDSENPAQTENYYLTHLRRFGANKYLADGGKTGLRFAVWAPSAQKVEAVFALAAGGYIADNSDIGIDPSQAVVPLLLDADGVWVGDAAGDFELFKGRPYLYRILTAQEDLLYRTDIFSRSQIGKGNTDPAKGAGWDGAADTLLGSVSCSVVIDPDLVRRDFASTPAGAAPELISAEEFWATEYTPGLDVPSRVEDLVIYELHVGALGFGKAEPGDLADAIVFLDHLQMLGVNAVELLPMAQFAGNIGWGYGDTHHLCIESSAGGRDKYRHFVRECHRRGIAVLQDVVYNHYDNNAARAEWQYDSTAPEQNCYYWYEGKPSDYSFADGGYLDNGSSGYTPRFWEENVRQQFISAAAFLVEEMHVDGLRVDLTQAIHRDNQLHANGASVGSANIFGQKFLREWSRTLRMLRPNVMLIAEDHTGWDAVTKLPAQGGLGFDAAWYLAFYHNLIGDSDMAGGSARLLKHAGYGWNDPLPMDSFSAVLYASQFRKVVFHESHDEAGNAGGTARTLRVAVNNAPLLGDTRRVAEARVRVSCGLSLLSAATPMFFMGEEIGAQQPYTYNDFLSKREDILGERNGSGKQLFRFYQDIISLSRRFSAVRSHNIDILHQSNANRVLAFKRWSGDQQIIVAASFNDAPFNQGYRIEKDLLAIPNAGWKEVFNSDAAIYGGNNVGNYGMAVFANQGRIQVNLPANGFVVFVKQ